MGGKLLAFFLIKYFMTLKKSDFEISQDQLDTINRHFAQKAAAYKAADEDGAGSVKVVFEWVPVYGRFVTAFYDGEIKGCEVEGVNI